MRKLGGTASLPPEWRRKVPSSLAFFTITALGCRSPLAAAVQVKYPGETHALSALTPTPIFSWKPLWTGPFSSWFQAWHLFLCSQLPLLQSEFSQCIQGAEASLWYMPTALLLTKFYPIFIIKILKKLTCGPLVTLGKSFKNSQASVSSSVNEDNKVCGQNKQDNIW